MFTIDEERTYWFMRQVLPHEPALRAWLSGKRSAGIDVDDVIQETYTILAAQVSVADIRHPRAYLFQVAQSVVVHHVRRSRIVSIQAADDLDRFNIPDEAASPERIAMDRDELRSLAEAIAAMPRQMRQAFILRRVRGLPQRQVAAQMRLSESTVEKHIARGLRFLIDWFGYGGKAGSQASKVKDLEIATFDGKSRNKSGH